MHQYAEFAEYDERAEQYAELIADAGYLIATRIHRIAAAMVDFDDELALQCVDQLRTTADRESRDMTVAYLELAWMHQCGEDLYWLPYVSGELEDPPPDLDIAVWPEVPRIGVRKGARALVARTRRCTEQLHRWAHWTEEFCTRIPRRYSDKDTETTARSIAAGMSDVHVQVASIVGLWRDNVITPHRKLARTQRGLHPPKRTDREVALAATLAQIDEKLFRHRHAPVRRKDSTS